MLKYNFQQFLGDLSDHRAKKILLILHKQKDLSHYLNPNRICDEVARKVRREKQDKRIPLQGRAAPSLVFKQLKYLIRIGCIEAHPNLGIRLNPEFIPSSQKNSFALEPRTAYGIAVTKKPPQLTGDSSC